MRSPRLTATKPDLIVDTERVEWHAVQCMKYSLVAGSLLSVVLGFLHIQHVTYSWMYFTNKFSMILFLYLQRRIS